LISSQIWYRADQCVQGAAKKIFLQFSQQSLGILKQNFTDVFSHPRPTYT